MRQGIVPLKRGANSSQRDEFHLVAVVALRQLRPRSEAGGTDRSTAEPFTLPARATPKVAPLNAARKARQAIPRFGVPPLGGGA